MTSGEPKGVELMREMHEKFGETSKKSEDIFAFYVLRQFQQELKSNKNFEYKDPKAAIDYIAAIITKFLGEPMAYLSQYNILNLDFSLIKLGTGEDFFSKYSPLLLKLEEILEFDQFTRDKNILKTIIDSHHNYQHQKILVIYGGDHYKTQLPVLEKYFGKPIL